MPVKSEKQRRLFEAVAHNPKFAKQVDIPQGVAKEMLSKSDSIHGYMDAVSRGDSDAMSQISSTFRK